MTYPGTLTYPGPYTFPGPGTSLVDRVRVECAFTTTPDDPAPAYQDISAWCDLAGGITITRYRQDEYSQCQPATASITLNNNDGRFTPGLSTSPYWPNVMIRKKVRVTCRDPEVDGNFLTVEDATFEAGTVGTWVGGGTVPPTLTNSTVHPASGAKSLLVTWGTAGTLPLAQPVALVGLVIGRAYTFQAQVYVPAGSPDVLLAVGGGVLGSSTAVKNAQTRISVAFTATAPSHLVQVWPATAPTAGQQCWVDEAQVDESPVDVGALRPFAVTAPPIGYRYTGYADEWPTAWPTGSVNSAQSVLLAVDRFKRLGTLDQFRSVVEQEYLSDNPYAYYTLGEPALSTQAGDTSKNGRNSLTIAQLGSGGTLTFGSGVGPPTDSLTAAVLAPVNTTNGKYLTVNLPASSSPSTGQGLDVDFLTSVAAIQTIAQLVEPAPIPVVTLQIDAAGKLNASSWGGMSVTSAGSVADGATHHAAVTVTPAGVLTLVLDGTSVGTSTGGTYLPRFSTLRVGGGNGTVFAGTISHVACYDTAPTVARFTDHNLAGTTGFSGERSDQRIARYARWAGIPAAEQVLEVGLSASIAAIDTTGQAPLQAMQDIADTESGILAINGAGLLTFQSRAHRYNTTATVTLTGDDLDTAARFASNDAYLINDVTANRPGGITYRAVNAQSVTDYGPARITPTLYTTSDNEVVDAANWKANQTSSPDPRIPNLTVDILSPATAANVAQVLTLDLSSRITAGALPAQAPDAGDLFIEGWTESITLDGWPITFNTSPAPESGVWQLDSPLYSQLGTSTRLAY